ncbi:competence protein TfoX [Pseudooceanicola sp. 216_PA32_1]|uniref:Competence protein TfoX n=1 Tax=Pseudooceanicola pacificus TaxID=2676438 RepID=A0A844W8X5_9RHOB|nr:TfoX/Sxy family DNA transformation protein [Pseudooceanicola pacificus]MWB77263.1 competence protein TfoX [Pseudooceanicola pacificus]
MSDLVSTIRNLGPAADIAYGRAGITSARQLREMGADAAYAAFLASGGTAHFIGYYALVMGLQGRPWNDCKGAEKAALRARFDRLRASTRRDDTGIEAILDEIGVRPAAAATERKRPRG